MDRGVLWTCPFCGTGASVRTGDFNYGQTNLEIENSIGYRGLDCQFIVCSNPKCKKFELSLHLYEQSIDERYAGRHFKRGKKLNTWRLIPESNAKVFPEYVPEQIRKDYQEACIIIQNSPKASATLSRRCLQGMIRDFWKVKTGRLVDEINQIENKIDISTWQAIDAVRKVGNIGAHMEADVNLIIDVEPNEANLLVGLVELLIKDWYIARQEREEQLDAIIKLSGIKEDVKKQKLLKPVKV